MKSLRKQNIVWIGVVCLFMLTTFVWLRLLKNNQNILSVNFLDVGQGDAIFIEAPNGTQMLIDGGKTATSLAELSHFIDLYDRSIDVVLATHPDADHIGGLPEIFDQYDISYFVHPGVSSDTNLYQELIARADAEKVKEIIGKRGMVIVLDVDAGVYFQILAPDPSFTFADTNNMSIVGRLVYGESEFLLTGDASKAVENILAYADGEFLSSDVLKAGHHGSKTSSGLLFLEQVRPEFSIISASYNNTYGHPHDDVINNLKSIGTEILETSKEGSITFQTDGKTLWRK